MLEPERWLPTRFAATPSLEVGGPAARLLARRELPSREARAGRVRMRPPWGRRQTGGAQNSSP